MERKGYILALLAGITWGTNGIISYNLAEVGVGPYEQTFLRLFFAFLTTIIFYVFSDRSVLRVGRKELKHIFLIGVISQGLMSFSMYKSIAMTSVTVGVILSCTGPLFTAFFSRLIFNEKINLFKGISLIMGFYGAFLVVSGGDLTILNANGLGLLIGLISGISYGLFPIFKNKVPRDCNFRGILMYSFFIGALLTAPLADSRVLITSFSIKVLVLSVILGVVPTVLAYTFYSGALRFTTPTKAGIMSLVEVPTAALIGHFFLGEHLYFINIVGIIILLTGTGVSKIELSDIKKLQIVKR